MHYYRIIVPLFHYYPKIDNTSQTIFIIMEQTMPEEEAFKLLKSAFHLSNNQLVYTGFIYLFFFEVPKSKHESRKSIIFKIQCPVWSHIFWVLSTTIFFWCKLTYNFQFFILVHRFFIATAKFQLKSYWTV